MPEPIPYTAQSGRALWNLARRFIDKQRITCGEAVYQSDRVIQNAYEFIEEIGELVGWYDDPEDA